MQNNWLESCSSPRSFKHLFVATAFLLTLQLTGCASSQIEKLERVGRAPDLNTIQNPTEQPNYQPVSWPTPKPLTKAPYANSLWIQGSKTFFRDLRASNVGDIVRVRVQIADSATLDNTTERTRNTSENLAAPEVLGLQNKIVGFLPRTPGDTWFGIEGDNKYTGEGSTARTETIQTEIAAMVTQILPNGNLVIDGNQEVRVNNEVRELNVRGVIRPEDISMDNTIDSQQIAEARISYGGRGQITDVQQPRIGAQIVDILSPF